MRAKNQHLESGMGQLTGSKLGKEYVKAIHCHIANLTYMRVKKQELEPDMKQRTGSKLGTEYHKVVY